MQGATADAQFSALNATSATPPARSYAKRKFKPRSAAALAARDNKLTTPKHSANSRAMCDIKLRRGAKFKEPLNFKVCRILKFTALKFRSVRQI
jgi:hypothetical protein